MSCALLPLFTSYSGFTLKETRITKHLYTPELWLIGKNSTLASKEELNIKSVRLITVRDFFVFSCYTGISYVDLILLTNESLVLGIDKTFWIVTERQKSRNPVKIPLIANALNMTKSYQYAKLSLINGTLFPKISNQIVNAYLKEVA